MSRKPIAARNTTKTATVINTEMPDLAEVANMALARSKAISDLPLAVPTGLYVAAREQLANRMRDRGFPVPLAGELAKKRIEHFMLNGTVVVPR